MESEPANPYAKTPRPELPVNIRRLYLVGAVLFVMAGLIAVGSAIRVAYYSNKILRDLGSGQNVDSKD